MQNSVEKFGGAIFHVVGREWAAKRQYNRNRENRAVYMIIYFSNIFKCITFPLFQAYDRTSPNWFPHADQE